GKYFWRNCSGNFIRNSTSFFGRFQFSVEKVNKVRTSTLNFVAVLTVFWTTSTPSLCPAIRGSPLFFADLPLPSIIIAICFGILLLSNVLDRFYFFLIKGSLNDIICPPNTLY